MSNAFEELHQLVPLSEVDLAWLRQQGLDDELAAGTVTPADVAERLRAARRGTVAEPLVVPPDDFTRAAAVSLLLAEQAADDELVVEFRRVWLEGGTIPWAELGAWIDERLEGGQRFDTTTHQRGNPSPPVLAYQLPDDTYPRRVHVVPGSELAQLRTVAESLVRGYGWREPQATVFVLTGLPPFLPSVRWETRRRMPAIAASRIVIEADPTTPPIEVERAFRAARREFGRERFRPISARQVALAKFVAEHPELDDDERRERWNAEYWSPVDGESWRFDDLTKFKRAAMLARRHLLNPFD